MPVRARVYVSAVTAAGVAAFATAVSVADHWPTVALLAALMLAFTSLSATHVGSINLSLGLVIAVASLTLVGAPGTAIVCAAGAAAYSADRRPLIKRFFNFAQLSLSGGLAGLIYGWLHGPVGSFQAHSFPGALGAFLLAAIVYSMMNVALVSGAIALVEGLAPGAVFRGIAMTAPSTVAYAFLGLMLAVLWIDYSPLSGLLLFLPLLSARWAIKQYAEQQKAYDATLRALITTIEVKDGYTRGHSERVSQIATMIARESHMSEDRVEAVRYAALLHDVGKTGIPGRILGKHGKLTDDEFDVIKTHPHRGVQMLDGIDFLVESLSGVYHHHERMDGRGYPLGLVGMEIPEIARIVMVADAFDAMTSTRSYRPARSTDKAVLELRRCQGEQFDPRMVDALVRAVDKQGWEGDPEPFEASPPTGVEPVNDARGATASAVERPAHQSIAGQVGGAASTPDQSTASPARR